jgi:hypothetical protein
LSNRRDLYHCSHSLAPSAVRLTVSRCRPAMRGKPRHRSAKSEQMP